MKPQPNFALDEIVGILNTLSEKEEIGEGFVSVQEIRRATGWSTQRIRDLLYDLKEEGRLEVGTKKIRFLDDRVCGKSAYRVKSKEEERE